MTTICMSDGLTVPPLVGCCLWNHLDTVILAIASTRMTHNDFNIECIIFGFPLLKQNLCDVSISVWDSQVSPSSKVRDLGVVFDQYLTFKFHDHISGICKSTHFHLRSIGKIRNLLTFDATTQLIHALITTRLDFCNSILYNLPNSKIERLPRIKKQAAGMLKRIPRRKKITPVLRELHWLKFYDRIIV